MLWYEDEVRQLETKLNAQSPATDRVVFYGSSSIRLWTSLAQDFPNLNTLNLGFGGSTLAACAWFFKRLVVPAAPRSVLFYAGDNDLGDGRHPEEVYLFFRAVAEQMHQFLPGVPLSYLTIKISPARWHLADKIRSTNAFITEEIAKCPDFKTVDMTTPLLGPAGRPKKEFFESDGLHLSPAGYRVWQQTLKARNDIF
ncbi:GDSL family lipase [Spirosoma taeanense]|uniref:GDSL family lipase n=1 Tax=Spirosoma taeanense TaxID=2735870 RepID=A0A6M5Y547_9BACT|nr:GDSL-type esterase/lipase family protein [Spirosoma taeanense]QJW88574.1 GDSL family lipase [Spirosoma taeanense]